TLVDVKTNVTVRTTTSDGSGNYEIPDVGAGAYRITVEMTGVKTFVADNVVVEGSQIRRVEARLEVGQIAERITVEAGATPITTDSAQITSGVKRQLYDESPMARNYYPHSLLASLPGVESQGSGWNM